MAQRYAATGPAETSALEGMYAELSALTPPVDSPYDEPSDLPAIMATLPAPATPDEATASLVDADTLPDRILGGWLGRIAGCNLGKPVEWGDHWTSAHIRDYLERAEAWPLRDYFPVLDPMPPGFDLRDNWPQTTRGRVDGSARDDDIDYAILGLHLLERHGAAIRPDDVATAWLTYLPYLQVYTAERTAIGTCSRGSRPVRRPRYAIHTASGSARSSGAMPSDGQAWAAAGGGPARVPGRIPVPHRQRHLRRDVGGGPRGLRVHRERRPVGHRSVAGAHPATFALAVAIRTSWTSKVAARSGTWPSTAIQHRYGHYSWVHTINNAALIAAGLLWVGATTRRPSA